VANQVADPTVEELDEIARAMWSIYYHSTHLPNLRPSVLELVQPRGRGQRSQAPLPAAPSADLSVGRGNNLAA
jgi:hypothetical protein